MTAAREEIASVSVMAVDPQETSMWFAVGGIPMTRRSRQSDYAWSDLNKATGGAH